MGVEYINLKYCSAILPANMSVLLHNNERNVAIISLVSASLSLIGSSSILAFMLWKKLLKLTNYLPLFHLSLADFVLALLWMMTTTKYFVSENEDPAFTAVSCFIWQLLTELTHLSTIFLTVNYAVHVYLKMRKRTVLVHRLTEGLEIPESAFQKRLKVFLYVVSWTLPLVIMSPIIVNVRSDRISACQKCVIFIDVAVLKGGRVPWEYGYIVLAVTLTTTGLLLVLLYCLSLRLYWKAVLGFRTDHQRKQLFNMQARVTVYLLVFSVSWAPGLWIAYHKWFKHPAYGHKTNIDVVKFKYLYYFQAFFAPLQGFFNSMVYGWTKKTFRVSASAAGHPDVPHGGGGGGDDFLSPYHDFNSTVSEDNITWVTDPPLGY